MGLIGQYTNRLLCYFMMPKIVEYEQILSTLLLESSCEMTMDWTLLILFYMMISLCSGSSKASCL